MFRYGMQTLDNAVAAMQRFPKYAAKFKHLGTSSFAVRDCRYVRHVISHRCAPWIILLKSFSSITQAKMFADNFLVEHQVSGKYKSLTKEEIASINFCKSFRLFC